MQDMDRQTKTCHSKLKSKFMNNKIKDSISATSAVPLMLNSKTVFCGDNRNQDDVFAINNENPNVPTNTASIRTEYKNNPFRLHSRGFKARNMPKIYTTNDLSKLKIKTRRKSNSRKRAVSFSIVSKYYVAHFIHV